MRRCRNDLGDNTMADAKPRPHFENLHNGMATSALLEKLFRARNGPPEGLTLTYQQIAAIVTPAELERRL